MRLIETYPGGLGYLLKERVLDRGRPARCAPPARGRRMRHRPDDRRPVHAPEARARSARRPHRPGARGPGPARRRPLEFGHRCHVCSSRSGLSSRTPRRSSRSWAWRARPTSIDASRRCSPTSGRSDRGLTVRVMVRADPSCIAYQEGFGPLISRILNHPLHAAAALIAPLQATAA